MLNEESLVQKFIKKGFWLYLFTFLAAPLGYIIKMTLARDLSVAEFWLFYGIISLITLLSALNDLGGTETLNYFLPKYIIKKEYGKIKYILWLIFKLQIFSSLLIITIIFAFSDAIAQIHFKDIAAWEILQIMSLFFLWNNILHICSALFSATQNTKLHKWIEFLRLFSTTILMLSVFFMGMGNIVIYAWIWIIGVIVGIIFSLFFAYKHYYTEYLRSAPLQKDITLRSDFIKYSIPTFLTANISLLLSQIDAQLVTGMLGNEAQCLYSNYLSIMTLPFIFLSPLLAFLFPVFSELHSRKNFEKIHILYKNIFLLLIILSIWISFFLYQTGVHWAKILFGVTYAHSGIILQFSIPFLIFNILNQLNFQLLAGTGKAWSRTVSFAIVLPINIALNILFIPIFSVEGSALAVGMSWIPLYLITLYATRKYISLPPIFPIIINIVASIVAFGISAYIFNIFQNISLWWELGIMIVIYGVIFISINIFNFQKILKILKH